MKDVKALNGFGYGEPEKRLELNEEATVSNADAEQWEAKGLVTIIGDHKTETKPDTRPGNQSAD